MNGTVSNVKLPNSMTFNILTTLGNHHAIDCPNTPITAKGNPPPFSSCSPFSSPLSPWPPPVCVLAVYVCQLWAFYVNGTRQLGDFFCLASSTWHGVFKVYQR